METGIPELLVRGWGVSALLVTLRIAPLLLLLPAALGERVPVLVRTATLLLLAGALTPMVGPLPHLAGSSLLSAGAQELVWGLGSAVLLVAIFETLRMAGAMVEAVAGRGEFGGTSPLGGSGGPLEQLHSMLMVASFLLAGGLVTTVSALAGSLQVRPPGGALSDAALPLLGADAVAAVGSALGVAVAMALPLWVAALMSDLGMGWLQRHLPELPIHFLGMPARALAAWMLLALVLGASLPWAIELWFETLRSWLEHEALP